MNAPDVSIVIPCRNEEANIGVLVEELFGFGRHFNQRWEVIVVDDHCTDHTVDQAVDCGSPGDLLHVIVNAGAPGYGNAVRAGLQVATGVYVTVMVADGSDSPQDLSRMLQLAQHEQYAAVFGDRWTLDGRVTGYPRFKKIANRLGNRYIGWLLGSRYTDWTNPFRLLRNDLMTVALGKCQATDFSLGMELAVHSYRRLQETKAPWNVMGVDWRDRSHGTSKFKIKHVVGFLRTLHSVLTPEQQADIASVCGLLLLFSLIMLVVIFGSS